MICADCAATEQPTRICPICASVMCRHDARRQTTDNGDSIVCKEPWGCLKRGAEQARAAHKRLPNQRRSDL